MESNKDYASNLTNRQWQIIRQLLPKPARRGRKPICRRWVIDAILYVAKDRLSVANDTGRFSRPGWKARLAGYYKPSFVLWA